MTQAQLDLARLGMMIARMQLKAMAATATALEQYANTEQFVSFERSMFDLSLMIENGEIRGIDAGQA